MAGLHGISLSFQIGLLTLLRKSIIFILACWITAGCGFQPLYETRKYNPVIKEFAYVHVAPIKDRIGQQLRNEILNRLHSSAKKNRYKYKLVTTLNEGIQALAVRKSAFATRANLTVTATFHLIAEDNDDPVLSAIEKTTVSYNILDSEFATLIAQNDAQKRAIESLGKDIVVRLAVFFDRQ